MAAFSLVELCIGLVFSLLLGVFAYRTFTTHVGTQMDQMKVGRRESQVTHAIGRIKEDLEKIDRNWQQSGALPIAHEAGVGANGSDTLTFAVPDPSYPRLVRLNADLGAAGLERPGARVETKRVSVLGAENTAPALSAGDWVLVYTKRLWRLRRIGFTECGGWGPCGAGNPDLTAFTTAAAEEDPPLTGSADFAGSPTSFDAAGTVVQKVRVLTYRIDEREGKTYLVRGSNGREAIVGPAAALKFTFDLADGREDQTSYADPAQVTAVRAQLGAGASVASQAPERSSDLSKRTQTRMSVRVAFRGGSGAADASNPSQVLVTAPLSTYSLGRPLMERYANGSRLFVPLLNGTTLDNSTGGIRIVDGESGAALGEIPTTYLGRPFLPTSMATITYSAENSGGVYVGSRVPEGSPGVVAGGYYKDASGERIPLIAVLERDFRTGTIPTNAQPFFLELPAVEGLKDTASIVAAGDWIYVAPVDKPSSGAPLRIFRVNATSSLECYFRNYRATLTDGRRTWETTGSKEICVAPNDSVDATQEYSDGYAAAGVYLSALGGGPAIGSDKFMLYSRTNSARGSEDGALWALRIGADGTLAQPLKVADTNLGSQGVAADRANRIFVSGRLTAKEIPGTEVQRIFAAGGPHATLNLDDKKPGTQYWYANYAVSRANIRAASPAGSQLIKSLKGLAVSPSEGNTYLSVTNDWEKNASVTEVLPDVSGKRFVAQIAPSAGSRLNAAIVALAPVGGAPTGAEAFRNLPPGAYDEGVINPTASEPCVVLPGGCSISAVSRGVSARGL